MRRVVVSYSGGKNSTAMLLMMKQGGIPIDGIVFADTGAELPETYEFILRVEERVKQKIDIVRHPLDFFGWFYRVYERGKHIGEIHGFPRVFGFRGKGGGWCTRSLKIDPLGKYAQGQTMAIGMAADEYHRTFALSKQYPKVYPLCEWMMTSLDCYNLCVEHDLLNPIYQRFGRSGCWTCPNQGKKQLRMLYAYYPDLWQRLLQLEKDSPYTFSSAFKLSDLHNQFMLELGARQPLLTTRKLPV